MNLRAYDNHPPRYCMQCRRVKPRAGGIERTKSDGLTYRWICADCARK